jgi:glucose-6-phosphate isomerase
MDKRIKLDFNNLMTERIGPDGISYSELEGAGKLAVQASQWFYAKRDAGKMDFFDLPGKSEHLKSCQKAAVKHKGQYDDFVVLGIGGSALGTIAVHAALNSPVYNLLDKKSRKGNPRLWVLDNVDPEKLKAVLAQLKAKRTLVNLISKSGTTAETSAQFLWIRQWLIKGMGKHWTKNIVVTTDPSGGIMRQIVHNEKLASLEVPSGVGGRFSVLTPVGLFPLAMVGVNIKSMLDGAEQMRKATLEENPWRNPARLYALTQYLLYQKGKKINVMMSYSDSLYFMADWFRQLWAESLGKRVNNQNQVVETGPTPIKALGVTDQHSQLQLYIEGPRDKVVTFLRVEKFRTDISIPKAYSGIPDIKYLGGKTFAQLLNSEGQATAMALAKNGRPNCTFAIPEITPATMGQLIFLLETATAYAGGLFGINPMDQPGVEEGKRYTYGLMDKTGFKNRKVEVEKFEAGASKKYII